MKSYYQIVKKSISENPFLWLATILLVVLVGRHVFVKSSARTAEVVIKEEPFKIEEKVFGQSVLGRDIEGYVIGSGSDTLLLFAAMHGDETGTADLLNQLVEEVKKDNSLVAKSKKLVVIPVSNPDGYEARKNKLNANGVNLNLNFATSDWQTRGPEGTFAGEQPFSEPESRVIRDIVEQYKPSLMISYHSQGAVVSPEFTEASIKLAKWYAEKSGYQYYNYWDYPGVATKWFEEATGNPAITVEISTEKTSDWEANKPALLELMAK